MRFLIIVLSVLLVPVLVIAHLWIYDEELKPDLAQQALAELQKLGVQHANVKLDYLDATITGVATDVEVRERAAEAMKRMGGIHFLDKNNLVAVPAGITSQLEGATLILTGWLPNEKNVTEVQQIISEFRRDLKLDAKKLRISPLVSLGGDPEAQITAEHRLMRPILERLRTPASFAIEKSGGTYVLKGALPTALKKAVIEAVTDNPGGWTIDASKLAGGPHISESAFTKSDGLPRFLRSYFSAPTPGTFFIDDNGSPHITAHATKQMEAEWIVLLRNVSGAAKVEASLTLHPSVYQLPGYQPASEVEEGTLSPAVEALRLNPIYFDDTTNTLSAEEETKMAAVADLLVACGPGLRLILSGTGGVGTETAAAHHARCEMVKSKFATLGISAAQMEVLDVGGLYAPAPAGNDPAKQMSARVEVMVK